MPDNNIKLGAEIELKAKSVEQELSRIGKLAQQAISFEPQNKELQEMVNLANEVYNSVNKTTEAMKLEEQLTKSIADRSSAQNFVDRYASEKEKLLNLIDVRNAKGQDVSNQRAQLASLEQNLQAAQQLRDEYDQTVTALQSKLSALQQSGADIDKSLTFENARVSASGLLELLKQIDARSTGIIAVANSVSQVESVKDIPISTAGEDSGSQLEYFKDVARQLNAELPQLRANINELASEFFRMGETTSADSMAESFYTVGTSADELLEKYNSLVGAVEDLRETAKGSLSEEEFRQFDEVVKNLGKNLMLAGEGLDYLVAIDPEMDSGSIDEQIQAYQTYIGTLESVKEAYASADLSDEQRKLFDVGAGAQINEQIDLAKQHIVDLMRQKEAINNTPPIDIKMPEDTNTKLKQTSEDLFSMIQRLKVLEQEISAFNKGKLQLSDEDFVKKSTEIEVLKAGIEEYKNALLGVRGSANDASTSTAKVGSSAKKSSKVGTAAFNSLSKAIKSAFREVTKLLSGIGGKLTGSFSKVQKSIEKMFSGRSFKRGLTTILKYGFGVRSLYFAFRRLRTAVKEGLQNLVQYEKAVGASQSIESTNYAITRLNTALLYLKNAWAAAFAPVINVVAPILDAIVTKIAEVGNAIARFVGALTGQSVVLNAVKVDAQDYADSLDNTKDSANGASGATKKLSDRLASFDDLNVLGKDSDTGGSGGGGADFEDYMPDPSEMFTYVDAVSEFADMLKDAFNSGFDFTELGSGLADKIVDGLNNINWSVIQAWAINIGHGIGTFLTGALGDKEIWVSAGDTLAEGLNTISIFFDSFLEELSNIDFGGGFALLINNFFEGVNWEQVGSNLQEASEQLTNNINSFFSTLNVEDISLDLGSLASSITTAIVNVITSLNWEDIKNAAITIGDAILGGIQEGLESSDNPLFQNIGSLIGSLRQSFETLLPVITQVLDAVLLIVNSVLPILAEILPPIAEIIANLASTVFPVIQEVLQIIFPIISQLVSAILPVLQAVVTSLQPVFEAITTTVLPILTDLLSHLMPLIQSILGVITGILNDSGDLGTTLVNLTVMVLQPLFALLNPIFDILTVIFDLLGDILPPIVALISPLLDLLMLCLQPIFDNFEVIADIIDIAIVPLLKVLSAIIKVTVVPILNLMVSAVQFVSQAIGHLRTVMGAFKTAWKDAWDSVRNFTNSIFNSIIGAIEGLVNGMIGGINKVIGAVNSMSFTVPDWIPEIGGESFGFTLREISTISLPRLAEGAVIPPNREFMAVLGDQSSGTNIEAPLDTIKQAVAEVLANNGNAEMIQLLQQLITVVENKNLTIGDKDIGKANARYVQSQNLRRGASF